MTDQELSSASTLESLSAERNLLALDLRILEQGLADVDTLASVTAVLVRNSSRRAKREILTILTGQEDADAR
jgi:hypothetical protein